MLVINSQKQSVATTASMAPDARLAARLRSSPLLIPFVLIAVFHAAGWGLISTTGSTAIGAGVVAYLLGLRHACDADHIIAIDGASRAVIARGRPAPAIGFYFSLGHSAVVLMVTVMLTVGMGMIGVNVGDDSLRLFGATIGSALSGGFLLVIGALNVGILVTILRRRIHPGAERNDLFAHQHRTAVGGLSVFLGPVATRLDRPRRMFLVGVLFGFGLDTALSIGALVSAADASHSAGPIPLAFGLPVLFLAGMSLGDTVEGLAMSRAYRWAAEQPGRRWIPNVIITGASAVAAVVVGMIVLAGAGIAGTVAVAIVGGVGLGRAAVAGVRLLRDPRNPRSKFFIRAQRVAAAVSIGLMLLTGCSAVVGVPSSEPTPSSPTTPVPSPTQSSSSLTSVPLSLVSSAFVDGGTLPITYSCDGDGVSPPLAWSGGPEATAAYAVVMHHVPDDGVAHWYWVLYNVDATVTELAEGAVPPALVGTNSVNSDLAYAPPCSKGPGPKLYTFTIYALDAQPFFAADTAVSRDALLAAIDRHVPEQASLTVTYDRATATEP